MTRSLWTTAAAAGLAVASSCAPAAPVSRPAAATSSPRTSHVRVVERQARPAPTRSPVRASRTRRLEPRRTKFKQTARNLNGPSDAQLLRLRLCESGGNYRAVSASGRYRGAYQFDRATWRSVGGHGDPAQASPTEQDNRARLLYAARGWQPWPHCGRRAA